jgi:hypothetical protein
MEGGFAGSLFEVRPVPERHMLNMVMISAAEAWNAEKLYTEQSLIYHVNPSSINSMKR